MGSVTMPPLGLGTWLLTGRDAQEGVTDALELGYRHIDTARAYENEAEVGRGIAAAGVDREEVWLTTKLWKDQLRREEVRDQLEDSLRTLGTEYVDLLLIHWPNPEIGVEETLEAMLALHEEGKVRHLGVSNFPSGHWREALEHAPVEVNQVEFHPYLPQPALLELARERDLTVTAYSPFARGKVFDDPVIKGIGDPAQVTLAWLLGQPNVAAVPKAASHEKRRNNLAALDLELTEDQRHAIAALGRGERIIDPSFAPAWD